RSLAVGLGLRSCTRISLGRNRSIQTRSVRSEWKASFAYRPDFTDLFGIYPNPRTAANNAGKEVWELYCVNEDPTELNDLAQSEPAKLKEMQALFDQEAKANQVYPLINWSDLFPGFKKFQEEVRKRK
ncbi:MAG: hypothetical protein ACK557_16860, partial [Planctomycetota bacterium]